MPNQIGTCYMTPDLARWVQSHTLMSEGLRLLDKLLGTTPSLMISLFVVNVVNEPIKDLNALLQPSLYMPPLKGFDNTRN